MSFTNKIKVFLLFFLLLLSATTFSQNSRFKVTLDAGHGDQDYGAV